MECRVNYVNFVELSGTSVTTTTLSLGRSHQDDGEVIPSGMSID